MIPLRPFAAIGRSTDLRPVGSTDRPEYAGPHGCSHAERKFRLRTLVEVGVAPSSELSLDGLLQRLVEAAAELTGARYEDGQGFGQAEEALDGFGLVGMRERPALLGGRLEVESGSETGTTVAAEVPLA